MAAPIAVGSTIWASRNVKTAGNFTTNIIDYGGYFNWYVATSGSGTDFDENIVSSTGSDGSVCPAGWRLPTAQEIANLIGYTGKLTDYHSVTDGYTCRQLTVNGVSGFAFLGTEGWLFFPYAGWNGGTTNSGTYGHYWSSTEYDAYNAYNMFFWPGPFGDLYTRGKGTSTSVRCVKSAS